MSTYRKKPVEVQAWTVRDLIQKLESSWSTLPEPVRKAYDKAFFIFAADGIHVRTLEGNMKAEMDDWIICGVKGELYPCKPDIFEATYEKVEKASETNLPTD
jgi:hypothetical protein